MRTSEVEAVVADPSWQALHILVVVLGILRRRPSWRRKSRLLKFLVSMPFFLRFFRHAHVESRYDRLFLLLFLNAFVMNRPSFSWWHCYDILVRKKQNTAGL